MNMQCAAHPDEPEVASPRSHHHYAGSTCRIFSTARTVACLLLSFVALTSVIVRGDEVPDDDSRWQTLLLDAATSLTQTNVGALPVDSIGLSTEPLAIGKSDAKTAMAGLDTDYRLLIGDQISFRIMEDEDEARQLLVTDFGKLEIPYLGRIQAEGRTCSALAEELKAKLEKDYYYQATVIIAVDRKSESRGKVYLVGAVQNPGPVEIQSDETMTVSKAILCGGGFEAYADERHVKVTRKKANTASDEQIIEVNVSQIFVEGRTDLDIPLQPGDLIYVPKRTFRF